MELHERSAHWMSAFQGYIREDAFQPELLGAIDGCRSEEVIGEPWRASTAISRIDRMLGVDVNVYLPAELLVKMDMATMAYSIKGRSPFLDHKLMEFTASLPAQLKLAGVTGNRLLKGALRDVLPGQILFARRWASAFASALAAHPQAAGYDEVLLPSSQVRTGGRIGQLEPTIDRARPVSGRARAGRISSTPSRRAV
jgi:asparagine synthetase B (glutamine-hydrolysing)